MSAESQKGRHTTSTARLWPLACGGYVVDTPGIRQFQLWDVIPAEIAGYYRDLRPYINHCNFPNCTHTHERGCAVKNAVADGWLDLRQPLREQIMLAMPIHLLCRPDCKGLCTNCGQNWNEGPCNCSAEDLDPRLAALKNLL